MCLCSRNALVTFVKKTAIIETNDFSILKHGFWDSSIVNLAWRNICNYGYSPFNIILPNLNRESQEEVKICKINDFRRSNTAFRFF